MATVNLEKFFGAMHWVSNQYFTFNHIVNDDEIIVITNNVKKIKNSFALAVDNNKVVYLKEWNMVPVRNYDLDIYAIAVKLNRKYWKEYTLNSEFDDLCFEQADTFDSLKAVALEQNNTKVALGWGK